MGWGKMTLHTTPKIMKLAVGALSRWLREWAPPLIVYYGMAVWLYGCAFDMPFDLLCSHVFPFCMPIIGGCVIVASINASC